MTCCLCVAHKSSTTRPTSNLSFCHVCSEVHTHTTNTHALAGSTENRDRTNNIHSVGQTFAHSTITHRYSAIYCAHYTYAVIITKRKQHKRKKTHDLKPPNNATRVWVLSQLRAQRKSTDVCRFFGVEHTASEHDYSQHTHARTHSHTTVPQQSSVPTAAAAAVWFRFEHIGNMRAPAAHTHTHTPSCAELHVVHRRVDDDGTVAASAWLRRVVGGCCGGVVAAMLFYVCMAFGCVYI